MEVITKFVQSIRFRIALVFVMFLLFTLESLGVFFVHQMERQDLIAFQDQITLPKYVTDRVKQALEDPDTSAGNDKIQEILAGYNNNVIQNVQIIDKSGNIRGSLVDGQQTRGQKTEDTNALKALANDPNYLKTRNVSKDSERQEIMTTPLEITTKGNGREVIGVAIVDASLKRVYENINKIMWLFIIAGLIALMASILLALFLARTITRPIEIINKQTTRIAAGDYTTVNHIFGSDELGQLGRSVNELSQRIEDSTETVNAERNRLTSVLTHMADGVLLANRQGQITIINQSAAKFIGINPQKALNHSIIEILGLSGEKTLADLLDDQTDFQINLSSGGRDLIVQAYVSLIRRKSGLISGIVMVLHDITEQEKIDAERRMFVSNVSHELRTPLTSVRSYVDALADGAVDDKRMAQNFLAVVQDETERMSRMINDLLELSRLDQGTMEVRSELVNLNSLFGFVLDRFDMILENQAADGQCPGKPYRIVRKFANEDIWVEVDPDKFTQVLDNLMNNALKYSPDGGTITVTLKRVGQEAIISISDQGLGIPAKDLENVFNRFFRVDKSRSRRQGGTGLGLAISKEMVERFNGRIWVESVENQGSTFYIALKIVDDDLIDAGEDWNEEG
ncbi:ATP-binding protein [Lactobacillaceae bacterium L1_55_11]|nr:ATP-binding protein [Lactobacillaceae bacterium L1_55_11]